MCRAVGPNRKFSLFSVFQSEKLRSAPTFGQFEPCVSSKHQHDHYKAWHFAIMRQYVVSDGEGSPKPFLERYKLSTLSNSLTRGRRPCPLMPIAALQWPCSSADIDYDNLPLCVNYTIFVRKFSRQIETNH